MNANEEIDGKLARIAARVAARRDEVRTHLEAEPDLLAMAEACRETFGARLVYVRVGEFEQGDRAAFERRGQPFNFDLRPADIEPIRSDVQTSNKPKRRRRKFAAVSPAVTWHDRY